MVADDTMSLISPAMHAEFSLPYVNRIAEAVGPLAGARTLNEAEKNPLTPAELFREADALDAPLDRKLAYYEDATRAVLPDVLSAYDRLVSRLQTAAATSGAPIVGDEMPDFVLPDHESHLVSLSDLTRRGPVVVSVNRGHWCPYCRLELRALARASDYLERAGAQVVSIVPETAEYAARMRAEQGLPFKMLSDVDLGYALSLGLRFWIGEELTDLYRKLGIELERFHRAEGWFLPVPATFVVDRRLRILGATVNPDFRRRMTLEQIEAALLVA